MGIIAAYYKIRHPNAKKVPIRYQRSMFEQIWHTIRKFICQNIAPNCVTNFMRVNLYRLCGFKIGKNVFIGMKCYFDDLCPENMIIEDNVGISYGVYFSCHGRKQNHNKIVLKNDCHLGFRCSILAREDIVIGERAMVGAMSFVNKSIPPYTTAAGIPCRVIKQEDYRGHSNNTEEGE